MAAALLSGHLCRPIAAHHPSFRRPAAAKPARTLPDDQYRPSREAKPAPVAGRISKRALRSSSSSVEQLPPAPAEPRVVDAEGLVKFLYEDLPHLFDEQGIDRSMYDERVRFRDPITKHDTIDGYLFNIRLLKLLFRPDFQLHHVRQTGPYEITTRWTMVMRFVLLPWKPELVFTGISIMAVNPQTQKFCSHVDVWDSIENNEYFSLEGLWDVLKQLRIYKTPDLETPKYHILKRTATYEVWTFPW